jgi:hypothetical protein
VFYVTTPLKVTLQVTKALRGAKALDFLKKQQFYQFETPLHEQEEFLVVHVVLDYLDGPENELQSFSDCIDFGFMTEKGELLDPDCVVADYGLQSKGYPPFHVEGWVRGRIRKGSLTPMLVYWPALQFEVGAGNTIPAVHMRLDNSGETEATAGTVMPASTPIPTKVKTPTPTATARTSLQLIADSQADFTGGQGQNSWEYLFAARDTFNWKQLTFDGSCYRVTSGEPLMGICADQGAPGLEGDIAWLYKAETSGRLLFRVTARKAEASGDDIEICAYRHTSQLKEWDLDQGDTMGFTDEFEVDANGGEMFFFTMQVSSIWREFKDDPNLFRVQVFLKQ